MEIEAAVASAAGLWQTLFSWIVGGGGAIAFIVVMRHLFKVLVAGEKAAEANSRGEARIHEGYAGLLDRYDKEREELTGRIESIRKAHEDDIRRLIEKCTADKEDLERVIANLQERIKILEAKADG